MILVLIEFQPMDGNMNHLIRNIQDLGFIRDPVAFFLMKCNVESNLH